MESPKLRKGNYLHRTDAGVSTQCAMLTGHYNNLRTFLLSREVVDNIQGDKVSLAYHNHYCAAHVNTPITEVAGRLGSSYCSALPEMQFYSSVISRFT